MNKSVNFFLPFVIFLLESEVAFYIILLLYYYIIIIIHRTMNNKAILPEPTNQNRSSHRDSFRKYLFFFSRSNLLKFFQECPFVPRTDMNFPGGSICSSNRHEFSRRVYMFFERTRIFQKGLSKRHVFSRRFYLFVEQILLSHRTDINISQKPLFSSRTHTNFPGDPYYMPRSKAATETPGKLFVFEEWTR